jgi:hypothetical protein
MISLGSPPPAQDSGPDVAFAVHEPKRRNLRKLLTFAAKNYHTSINNFPQKHYLSVTKSSTKSTRDDYKKSTAC